MKFEKKQRGEKLGQTKKEKPKKKAFPKRHIFEAKISNGLDNKESKARDAKSNDEGFDRSPKKPQEEKEPSDKSRTKLQHKQRQEKGEETKKQEPKKKPVTVRFTITAFDVYVTPGVPIGGREIMEITKSSMDKEYDEVRATWVKEWKIEQNASELTCMPEFSLAKKDKGESFKRNFIIYLVTFHFSGPKNSYCSKSILKYVKDVNQIASLHWSKFVP
ncbi:hypothetical protein Cgig2_024284 [Carnegiea gigantea]|uniref:Uncharacterized protein n=1 Tax=Carnegiea gigantea TaxID=171969 RepID=A0A9Q1JJQ0_9CARY|nr:hypothetical protein Cgig2_024284 [Carnegiea gigantea]